LGAPTLPRKVETLASKDRLESWKEIAAYLNRSERTVRRWEEKEGLPVHRLAHDKRGSVYAFTWELEAWRESRRQLIEAEPPEAAPSASVGCPFTWRHAMVVVALVASAVVAGFVMRSGRQPAYQPNPEAVRLVQLANFSLNAGRTQIETGIRYLQDAIRLDPKYAPAWAGLATAHLVRVWFAEVPVTDSTPLIRKEAEQAVRLDPNLGQPWRVLAGVSHFLDWEHTRAEAEFLKAQQLSPTDPAAFSWFGDFLVDMRRFDLAREAYKHAQQVAPRWLEPIAFVGNTYLFSGHPDLAIVEYQRVLDSEPNYGLGHHFLGRAYVMKGDYEKGIAQLRKSNDLLGDVPFSIGDLGFALGKGGRRQEAEALRADLVARMTKGYYPPYPIALIELGLGNLESALDWIERATDEHNVGFYLPSVDPSYDAVRTHPRFRASLKRMNLDSVDR
jgi:tetratricopeptide (TPR) repeat protein